MLIRRAGATMSANHYPFQVGNIECMALLDGVSPIERDRFLRRYPDAAEADYRQAFAEIGLTLADAISSLNVLLVRMGDETILVDAGEGGRPRGGQLLSSMQAAGVDPAAVTLVIITHTHGDHVQGLLTEAGCARLPQCPLCHLERRTGLLADAHRRRY
jgi:glyoxylase-like metal-dependent hydrolase (beta-lactamase superfamily II)